MHNVRLERIEAARREAEADAAAVIVDVDLAGEWRTDEAQPQFVGAVAFPQGKTLLEADFPGFLGGDGRAPSPLAYCFFGAMCCYGSTFALQAAMAGVQLRGLSIRLRTSVDFRGAMGLQADPPLSGFDFEVEVDTDAPADEVQRVKRLADERCPAIWAMDNPVPHTTAARKVR